jgi:hypothetical protein
VSTDLRFPNFFGERNVENYLILCLEATELARYARIGWQKGMEAEKGTMEIHVLPFTSLVVHLAVLAELSVYK